MAQRKLILIAVCASLVALPLAAEEEVIEDGPSLMEQGAQLFFKGLQQEMEPALEGLRQFAEEIGPEMQSFWMQMGPALSDLAAKVEDWSAYHPPEMLPNGDIIIRRKDVEDESLEVPEEGEIDI